MTSKRQGASAPVPPFPLLPLRSGVLLPGTSVTLPLGRPRSLALAAELRPGDVLAVATQRDPKTAEPASSDLLPVGTFARVEGISRLHGGEVRIALEGLERARIEGLVELSPFWKAEGGPAEEEAGEPAEVRALVATLRDALSDLARVTGSPLGQVRAGDDEPGLLADQAGAALNLGASAEYELLADLSVPSRLRRVVARVAEAKTVLELKKKIDSDVRRELGKGQRDAVLREQLKAIQRELGERGEGDLETLKERLDKAGLTEEARAVADRELRRLEALSPQQAEYNVVRTYLEWIADLPWTARADAKTDLSAIEEKLEADHFGLGDVKKRILEHMAVLKLGGRAKGSILCLAGPPGVGKTSIAQSIADATGRPFVRIALGGVRDEAEVRGHRRTYVGALPGRIVAGMKKAKVRNPVVLLDEIDKLFQGWSGSPEAALLEVLDPEQNATFTDHYLELPLDLSEVLFVCTANDLSALSAPLRDRLEVIEVSGYTLEEKVRIARRHLLPKQIKEHALGEDTLTVSDEALRAIAGDYTREAGVRQLARELKKLARALTLEVAKSPDEKASPVHVDAKDLARYLGKPRFFGEVAERTQVPGVATGLAWTPVGGDILFIETSRMPGKGRLEITGQLGDVMKESAKAALSFVRSQAGVLGVDVEKLEREDLHIHVPAGAVPKDGPSAGVTMFTALTSLLSGRCVRPDTAMTGECTLRGRVLPVGGIKAKVLAAHRAGIKRVILPAKNERDLDDVPESVRASLEFHFVADMRQAIDLALEPAARQELSTPSGRLEAAG